MTEQTHMRREIEEIPAVVATFLERSGPVLDAIAAALREKDPLLVATVARGSSDHASAYLKYAIELTLGLPVASIGPSIASIYGKELRLDRAATIAISQSGKSPDIVGMAQSARRSGATAIAITNTAGSPLAEVSDFTIDLHAGVEQSVAATKTFVTSVVAGLALVARWSGDTALGAAVDALPKSLAQAVECDWSAMIGALDGHNALYVLGRGPGFAIANEAARRLAVPTPRQVRQSPGPRHPAHSRRQSRRGQCPPAAGAHRLGRPQYRAHLLSGVRPRHRIHPLHLSGRYL